MWGLLGCDPITDQSHGHQGTPTEQRGGLVPYSCGHSMPLAPCELPRGVMGLDWAVFPSASGSALSV